MITEVREAGQRGLLLESGSVAEALLLHHQLHAAPPAGMTDVVPAAAGTLVEFRRRRDAVAAAAQMRRLKRRRPVLEPESARTLDVVYDDDALAAAADLIGASTEALLAWHTERLWMAAFYIAPSVEADVSSLTWAPAELTQRNRLRRTHREFLEMPPAVAPSTAAHAAAVQRDGHAVVSLTGSLTAIAPGVPAAGWHVLGHFKMSADGGWPAAHGSDVTAGQTSLAGRPTAGDLLSFRPVREAVVLGHGGAVAGRSRPSTDRQHPAGNAIPALDVVFEILDPGQGTRFQDAGRPGCAEWAIPRGGEADASAARQANQLVGNDDQATTLEVDSGGLRLRARQTAVIAVTGALAEVRIETPAPAETSNMARPHPSAPTVGEPAPAAETLSRDVTQRAPGWIYSGEELVLSRAYRGRFSYLAVSGGFSGSESMGSHSSSASLRAGQPLALAGASSRFVGIASVEPTSLPPLEGFPGEGPPAGSSARADTPGAGGPATPTVLRYVPGPQLPSTPLLEKAGHPWRVQQTVGREYLCMTSTSVGDPVQPGPPDQRRPPAQPMPPAQPGASAEQSPERWDHSSDHLSGHLSGHVAEAGTPGSAPVQGYPVPRGAILAAGAGCARSSGEAPAESSTESSADEPSAESPVESPSGGAELCVALPDHPVLSAWPVIGVIVREDRGLAAQLTQGVTARFVAVDPETLTPLAS